MLVSNSTGKIANPIAWLLENAQFFWLRLKGMSSKRAEISGFFAEIDGYAVTYHEATGRDLRTARVLEIGYGARPLRLMALQSLGFDAQGIDLDRPVLGSARELLQVYRQNGGRRLIKSAIRHVLFDGHERRALGMVLRSRGAHFRIDSSRFLVGDVAHYPFAAGSADFIFSEDVFEHIERSKIGPVCRQMARILGPGGVALISLTAFTGISGGHLVEWYPNTLLADRSRRTEPWEHLRKRRVRADCYLNELRLHEFEGFFSQYFDIVKVVNRDAGVGREFLTPLIRDELAAYSLDELLCNRMVYLLRARGLTDTAIQAIQ